MARRKINIFYLLSFMCTLILTIYVWAAFLPQVSGVPGQEPVATVVFVIVVLLLISAGIQLFLLISSSQSEE